MLGRVDFKDFDLFLSKIHVSGETLNHAFFDQKMKMNLSASLKNMENCTVITLEENTQNDLLSPLLVDGNEEDRCFVKGTEECKAAIILYCFLKECQVLIESEGIFTAYTLLNWIIICLPTLNDDNAIIQKKLRETSSHLLNGTRKMTQCANNWEYRMISTYGVLALMGFILTFIELPTIVSATFSPDMVSDILLNFSDILVNTSAAYRQFKLDEPVFAAINFAGGVQSIICTFIGIAMSVHAIIYYDIQSEKMQKQMEISENLLGVACAAGMFCSVLVEYLEYRQCKTIKNTLIDFLFDSKEVFKNDKRKKTLKYISDPIKLLKLCRETVETSITSHDLTEELLQKNTGYVFSEKISQETLVRGIAIVQAQSRNHANYGSVYMIFSLMMATLAACTFTSTIEESLTSSVIQGAVLLSALFGKYILSSYNNVEKVTFFLGEKTSQNIQTKEDKLTEIYNHSYSGRAKNILSIPLSYAHSTFFYLTVELKNSLSQNLYDYIDNGPAR